MAGPFDDLIPANRQQAGGMRPVFTAPADPYKAASEARADESARRSAERDSRQAELDAIRAERERLTVDKERAAASVTGGIDASVDQGKAAAFAKRAVSAMADYDKRGLDPDSMIGQNVSGILPNVAAAFSSDKRNAQRSSEREFIAAILRYDSGAAIPQSEFDNAYQIYFPSSSAGPEEIAAKARARKTAVEGLMIGAGPAAARVSVTQTEEPAVKGYRFTPTQEKNLAALLRDPTTTPDEYAATMADFARANGVNVDEAYIASTRDDAVAKLAAVRKGAKVADTVDYSGPDAQAQAAAEAEAAKVNAVDGAPGLGVLGKQGVTLGLSDEAAGIGNAIAGMFQSGDGSFADNYTVGRDAERLRIQQARENTGGLGTATEIGSALLSGGGVITGPVRAGITGGATAGFGYGEGAQGSTVNALLGAGAGGVSAKVLPAVGNALANRLPQARNSLLGDVAQAAEQEGVRVSRPIVDPSARAKMGYLETTPGGGNRVREGLSQTVDDLEARTTGLGKGQALDLSVAGETAQNAGRRTMQQTKAVVDRLYKRAESASAGVKVAPQNAISTIDQNLAELSQAPETNAGVIQLLEGLKSDLSQGQLSIQTLRQIRTGIRGKISEKSLMATDAERRAMQVLDAASQDIEQALAANPQALQAYKLADARYKQRADYIKQVLKPIMGPRDNPLSGEKVFAKIQQMASPKGNAAQMAGLWKSLTKEEADDIAATMAANLGRDAGGEFSPALLVSQAAKLSPKARAVAFGPDGARSLDNLIKIGNAFKDASGNINWSRSGAVRNYPSLLRSVVLGGTSGGGLALAGGGSGLTTAVMATGAAATAAGTKMAANRISAGTLMNPKFAKWLANAPNTTNARAIDQHFAQLPRIGVTAAEASGLRQLLIEAAGKSPGRATASENEQN